MAKKKRIYLLSPKIKFAAYKLLQKKLVKDSGPTPQQMDEMLWQMIRDKQIYAWFADDMPHDMGLGLKIPPQYKDYEVVWLTSLNKKRG